MKGRLFLVLKCLCKTLDFRPTIIRFQFLQYWGPEEVTVPSLLTPVEIQYFGSSAVLFPIFCNIITKILQYCSRFCRTFPYFCIIISKHSAELSLKLSELFPISLQIYFQDSAEFFWNFCRTISEVLQNYLRFCANQI